MPKDEQAVTEIHAGDETPNIKGVYSSIEQALGPELSERLAQAPSPENLSERDKVEVERLEKVWDGSVTLLESEGDRTFCLTAEGPDNLRVVAVVDFAGLVEEKGALVPQYQVNNWIVQKMDGDGQCIDLLKDTDSLPPDVRVFYQPESTQTPEGAVEKTRRGVCYYRNSTQRGGDKRIVTSDLTGALAIAHFEHECGHARDDAQLTEAERDIRRDARIVAKKGIDLIVAEDFDELENLETRHRMDYPTARFLVAKEELVATMAAKERLAAKKEILGINPDVEDRINADFERSWETYDTYVAPSMYNASETGRNLPERLVVAAGTHAENYDIMADLVRDLGITPGSEAKMIVAEDQTTLGAACLPPGLYGVWAKGGIIGCHYLPSDLNQPAYLFISSHLETNLDCLSRGDCKRLENGSASICVASPTALISSRNVDTAIEAETFFSGVIAEMLRVKETKATEKIERLKTIFGPLLPSIELLDPKEQFKLAAEGGYPIQPLLQNEEKARTKLMATATRPIRRHAILAERIAEKLAEECFGNKDGYNFDPDTGQKIEGEEKLRVVCEAVLMASNNYDKLPDWNTTMDPERAKAQLYQDAVAIIRRLSQQ